MSTLFFCLLCLFCSYHLNFQSLDIKNIYIFCSLNFLFLLTNSCFMLFQSSSLLVSKPGLSLRWELKRYIARSLFCLGQGLQKWNCWCQWGENLGKTGKANASLAPQTEFLCLPGFKIPNLNTCSIFILLSLNFLILSFSKSAQALTVFSY